MNKECCMAKESRIDRVKNWFKRNKVKLIGLGLLTGGAVVGYKMLPNHITIDGLFKDKDIMSYDILTNEEKTSMDLLVYLPGKRFGKVFFKGPEALIGFSKDEAIEFADEIYKAVGHVPGVIEVNHF